VKIDKELYQKFFNHICEFYSDRDRFDEYPDDEFDIISSECKSIYKAMEQMRHQLDINLYNESDEDFQTGKEIDKRRFR
jgi:hypothetical protein